MERQEFNLVAISEVRHKAQTFYQPRVLTFSLRSCDQLRPFFTDGLSHLFPPLEHHIFTIEQGGPERGPCVYIKDEEENSQRWGGKFSGTFHFDLFPIVRLLACYRLLALWLLNFSPHHLKKDTWHLEEIAKSYLVVLPGFLYESSTVFLSLLP